MNERIKELADEAKQYCFEQSQKRLAPEDYMPYSDMYDKKFAELIVKECADIANRQFSAATGLDDRDCLTAHQIKEHFGVK